MEQLGSGVAEIRKITTTVDGGLQIQLNFGSESMELIKRLLDQKEMDRPVMVAFVDGDLE